MILCIGIQSTAAWTTNVPKTPRHGPATPLLVGSESLIRESTDGFPLPVPSKTTTTTTATTPTALDGFRRKIMIWTIPSLLSTTALSSPAFADVGHAIRKSASNLPGYGPSDVYYPIQWQGLWNMKREIIRDGDAPNLTFNYRFRFLPADDTSNQPAAVADRGYNQAHLEAAIRGLNYQDETKTTTDDIAATVRSYDWSVNNPNDLQVALVDGSSKYIKVTKRATETTDTTVYSSEFQRVSQQDAVTGIPVVTARRVMTKWKVGGDANANNSDNTADSRIEGLEIVYEMAGGGDPLSATTATALSSSQSEPKVLSKSRLLLERLPPQVN
jgi:hypothetical protein